MQRAVVTVVGKDHPGIIAKVANTLADHQANILDLSQTLMDDIFTMSMLVDVTTLNENFATLQTDLDVVGGQLGVEVHTQREELFNTMSQV
ncbi:MAG: ACT domain-containing protein [Lactobacillaceae bacterium]|jgi:ACT domain-containing protein|nr:ACT domain-containing protein [Lactobacillaceae bacterium]